MHSSIGGTRTFLRDVLWRPWAKFFYVLFGMDGALAFVNAVFFDGKLAQVSEILNLILGLVTLSQSAFLVTLVALAATLEYAYRSRLELAQLRKPPTAYKRLRYVSGFACSRELSRSKDKYVEELPLYITATPGHEKSASDLWQIIHQGLPTANPVGPPPNDLDAPKLPDAGKQGLVIHGRTALVDGLYSALSTYVPTIYRSQAFVDELNAYFSKFGKKDVTWIEIGRGPMWKPHVTDD